MESPLANNKIRLAILILAHKNIIQLNRLLSILNHEDVDIFLHIDKKWELENKEYSYLENINKNNIFICDKRISCKLFDWSLIEAEMETIIKAKKIEREKKIHYHYYLLLSGQDYPIKSIDYILSFLRHAYPKPFIDCTSSQSDYFLKRKFTTLPFENNVLRFFLKFYKPDPINKIFQRILKIPFYAYFLFLKMFIKTPLDKFKTVKCNLYTGSQWWILPDLSIEEIYKIYSSKNTIVKLFSKTFGPDESFFQTLVMQTSMATMVEINDAKKNHQNCLTYAHFIDKDKPFIGHPYILKENDFWKLKNLPHFFARKFDITIDPIILELLDEYIDKNKREIKTTPVTV